MFDLTFGEWFVVGFILVAVLVAPVFPKMGMAIADAFSGEPAESTDEPDDPTAG